MTLTLGHGPLAPDPHPTNYTIDGPAHRLAWTPFPRRVRAEVGSTTIVDTTRGMLLHESNILPQLYVPTEDVADVLAPTDHTTHCPFKGDAAYWSVQVGDRVVDNAAWGYPEPMESAPWLDGHVAFYWDRVDGWFDEDEPVRGHLRDPYHRVDVRRSSRRVKVSIAGEQVALSDRARVLSETGLANRWYLPADDVDFTDLASTTTTSHCPYKGDAVYWTYTGSDEEVVDVAFSYQEPQTDALEVAGYFAFAGDAVTTDVAVT